MHDYIVTLKEGEELQGKTRRELYETGVARTATFQRQLRAWLNEQGLDDQVAAIGEPTVFPITTVTCTPAVAEKLEALPDVDSVVRDSGDLGMVR